MFHATSPTGHAIKVPGRRETVFLLAGLMHKFQYLNYGLGLVLVLGVWLPPPLRHALAEASASLGGTAP